MLQCDFMEPRVSKKSQSDTRIPEQNNNIPTQRLNLQSSARCQNVKNSTSIRPFKVLSDEVIEFAVGCLHPSITDCDL